MTTRVKSYMLQYINSIQYSVNCLMFQGQSVKFSPQRVGLHHMMCHDDVIQVVKKLN